MTYCDFYKSFCLVEKPQKDKPLENPSLLGGYPPFLVLHFSYYTLMTFLMMLYLILLSMLMILLCSKCDQPSDLWQQLELASEIESDLRV